METISINVTELKQACSDHLWLESWLSGKPLPPKNINGDKKAPVYGSYFHKAVENYVQWLTSNDTLTKDLDTHEALWHELYDRFAILHINKIVENGNIDSALNFSDSLKAFCVQLINLKERMPGFSKWSDVFMSVEYSVDSVPFEFGDTLVLVSGKLDAIRAHPDYELEIVDYKLARDDNLKHDLLQIAIYAKLLNKVKDGIRCFGTIEYYEPQLNEVHASIDMLESIFQEIVDPTLLEIANFSRNDKKGQSDNKKRKVKDIKQPKHVDEVANKIQNIYGNFKLEVEVIDKIYAPQLIRYNIKPGNGVTVAALEKRAEDLQVALALKEPPRISPAKGFVSIDIPKEEPDILYWADVINDKKYSKNKSPLSFPVGTGIDGQVIIADFANPNMCHALVAGVAGGGKSEFLKALVASLIHKNNGAALKISIVDPKQLTFVSVNHIPHLTEPVIHESTKAIECLKNAIDEMDRRYNIFASEKFENLSQRFEAGRVDIPFYVIIFDEFADIILSKKKAEREEFENLVARIAAKGRAAGIHLVLSTQKPVVKVVTGLIKANLPLKICFRVTSAKDSVVVLDQKGGESLFGRGDLLCYRGHGFERAQAPYITQQELAELKTAID